jgi:hypothetical protein
VLASGLNGSNAGYDDRPSYQLHISSPFVSPRPILGPPAGKVGLQRDWLHMFRIDAPPVATQMIQCESIGDGADQPFVHEAVRLL